MNKVLLAVGLLSAGMAFGQNQTTKTSSTTTSTSNYNSSNTNNENSRNATLGTNSSTNRPTSTTGTPYNSGSSTGSSMGTSGMSTGSYSNSSATGSYNSNSMGNGTSTGSYSGSSTTGGYSNSGMGTSTTTPSTNGSYNSNSMGTGTSTTTPSTNGSYNTNSMGTGTSATTPTTTDTYNSGATTNGTTVTTNSTYSTETTTARPARTNDYRNFAYGIYAGVNTTRFRGESIDAENPSGRLGYQAGFFVRGGGRLFGQIGAEYFASSSNYFRPNDGQSVAAIRDQINIRYIQVPVYIGYKLTESDRGISAIRVQAGVEYANRISSTSGQFNLSDSEIKSGSFNALGQLGFDMGPFLIDLTYHHGLSNAVQITNFQGSSRRILSASVGFKF